MLALAFMFGTGYGFARVAGLPPAACYVTGVLFWPAVFLLLGMFGAALAALERLASPGRVRRTIRRIDRLDGREAEEPEYDAAFRDLRRAALRADPRRYLDRMRDSILRGGKSRDLYLSFLGERKGTPQFREMLEDLARRWDDPVSWHARKALRRERATSP